MKFILRVYQGLPLGIDRTVSEGGYTDLADTRQVRVSRLNI
jgi:hypothetical protein